MTSRIIRHILLCNIEIWVLKEYQFEVKLSWKIAIWHVMSSMNLSLLLTNILASGLWRQTDDCFFFFVDIAIFLFNELYSYTAWHCKYMKRIVDFKWFRNGIIIVIEAWWRRFNSFKIFNSKLLLMWIYWIIVDHCGNW